MNLLAKELARCRKLGAGHIDDYRARRRKVCSRLLWNAVVSLLAEAASHLNPTVGIPRNDVCDSAHALQNRKATQGNRS